VDLDGDVWVANRAFEGQGSVTKIQAEDCEGNDCVLFTRNIGEVNDIPRGLAIDENNNAWVGTYEGRELFQLDNETGGILNRYDVGIRVYGLAVDSEGIIWISNLELPILGGGKLSGFNINERRLVAGAPWLIPGCSNPYGIAVDGRGHVWLGTWTCGNIVEFDPETTTFETHTPGSGVLDQVRGIAADNNGVIWTVATATNRLGRYDPDANDWRTFDTCSQPMGVGVTGSGHIWTPCWDGNVYYFDLVGAYQGTVTAGLNPYSYSDMTGFQLRTFTARQGTWTVIYDCGYEACRFDELEWDGSTPIGTSVRARARSSADQLTWSAWAGPYDLTPADLGGLPVGRYLAIELTLQTTESDVSPLVTSVDVSWQRP
jgi:streptogramin lyase